MRKNIEIAAFIDLIFFYGFVLQKGNFILRLALIFSFLLVLVLFVYKKEKRICFAAGIFFAFFSSIAFECQNAKLKSLVPVEKAETVSGTIISSPVKHNKAYYSIKIKAAALTSRNIAGTANGTVTVFIKASLLESNLPGKICKNAECNFLIDEGAFLCFYGSFLAQDRRSVINSEIFFADSVKKIKPTVYQNIFLEYRAVFRQKIKRILWSWSKAGAFLIALSIGSKDYLAVSDYMLFRKSGLAHVLALSGFHLSVMCMFTEKIADFFKKKHHSFLLLFVSFFFVFVAGAQPSLVRAFIFLCLSCFCSASGIKPRKGAVLAFCFCVHVLIRPLDAFSLSFLLSYSAIWGITFLNPFIMKICGSSKNTVLLKLKESFAVSAGAQLATLPVQLCVFHSFSFVGIFSSIIVVPLVSLFFILGIFAIICLLFFPELMIIFEAVMSFLYEIIDIAVRFFSRI